MNSTLLALEKLAKWRAHFAGWQLGTRPKGDPECDAVRDHREVTILLRAELNALTGLLVKKGLVTTGELDEALRYEANALERSYQRRWPGVAATGDGLAYDLKEIQRAGWMKERKP